MYDGDMCSCRPVFTKEANEECERRIRSNAYVVGVEGQLIRNANKDFVLTAFNVTNVDKKTKLGDINSRKPKYAI